MYMVALLALTWTSATSNLGAGSGVCPNATLNTALN